MASAEVRTGVPPDIFVKKKKTDIFRRFSRKLRIEKALQLDFERVVFKESSKQGASKPFQYISTFKTCFHLKKAPNKEHRNKLSDKSFDPRRNFI